MVSVNTIKLGESDELVFDISHTFVTVQLQFGGLNFLEFLLYLKYSN